MSLRRGAARTVALLLLGGAPLSAQDPLLYLPLDSATTVRLHLTDGRRITGRLVAPFAPDSTRFVYCASAHGPCGGVGASRVRVVPITDVTAVETRRGSRATPGALIGALVTVGGAAIFCALTDTGGCDPAHGGFFSYVLLPAALTGAGLGALVGSSISVWARAP